MRDLKYNNEYKALCDFGWVILYKFCTRLKLSNTENPTLSYTFLCLGMHLKPAPNLTFLHFPTLPTLLSPCTLHPLPSVALS
jgi:hypothetical protein